MIIENNGRGVSAQGNLTVENSLISFNSGGGVKSSSGSLSVTNSTIRDNNDTGIQVFNKDATIKNCVIERNVASSVGGAIYCVYTDSINIENSWIVNNVAREAGAICLGISNCRIDNCVIAGNNAELWGGGIYCNKSTATITNCTIYDNSGGERGGGIGCQYNCDISVSNCILWNNSAILGKEVNLHVRSSPSRMTIGYSNIQGGMKNVFVGDGILDWGLGNIDDDPCFIQPGYWSDPNDPNIPSDPNKTNAIWVYGDYNLLPDSPCIDSGDPNYPYSPNDTDLVGKPRVIGGRIDMGAYEFNHIPVADTGPDRTVEAQAPWGATVTLDGSGSSDADSTPGTNDDIVYFDWYKVDPCDPNVDVLIGTGQIIDCNLSIGEHIILLEVIDKSGTYDSDEVTIIVQDTTPPDFELSVSPTMLWPPDHKMYEITPNWRVSDDCDATPDVTLVSIVMSEADDIPGGGNTGDDIQIDEDGSIYLRAERSGTSYDRIYTITYRAVDDSGNTSVRSATVSIPHDFKVLARIAARWLWENPSCRIPEDLNGDGIVNLVDFARFAENWIK
jgi:hypothetical protein